MNPVLLDKLGKISEYVTYLKFLDMHVYQHVLLLLAGRQNAIHYIVTRTCQKQKEKNEQCLRKFSSVKNALEIQEKTPKTCWKSQEETKTRRKVKKVLEVLKEV